MGIKPVLGAAVCLFIAPAFLTGCVANSSNPVVSVRSATIASDTAQIVLDLKNPGGRDLAIEQISYEISQGVSGFPVASGIWNGHVLLPAGADAQLPLSFEFSKSPLEPESNLLRAVGEIRHTDKTGFLGIRSLDLGATAFAIEAEAISQDPQ